MVKIIEGHMVSSSPCNGNIKDLQTLLALSFVSEVFPGLQANLCSFHGIHERLFLYLLAQKNLFKVVVVSRTRSLIAKLYGCEPYSMSVFLFLCLGPGLSIA